MLEATAEIGNKNRGNMKDDEELEMLLDEIPHATSHNHQHQKRDNHHVNGSYQGMYGLMYDGTSSHYHNHTCVSPVSGFSLHSDGSSSSLFSNDGQQSSLSDNGSPTPSPLEDFKPHLLSRNRSKMYISNDREKFDFVSDPLSFNGGMSNIAFSGCSDPLMSHQGRYPVLDLSNSLSKLSVNDSLANGKRNGPSWNGDYGSPRLIQATPLLHHGLPLSNGMMARANPNARIPHDYLEAVTSGDSFVIQGKGLNHMIDKGLDCSRRSQLDGWSQIAATCGNAKNSKLCNQFSLPPKCNSLVEARGYIYLMAKDQHGCRFLQRVFDEGSRMDVQIIFKEIIDHVVELMMNPFGNYLMQKLLEVCNEEQRMHILLVVTEEQGQLVRISLNTHGTRVVQKLIETLKTKQQISLVVSALEPGFLSLIKDLNGNHVVQRCLQCLSSEDNKFIFVAAAKYCVDIATHQHGCCVLQRCISHSTAEYREKLVEEISTNGLLLAQDAYGNYVVQFILELKIPSATSTLVSQFEGNYVHLSLQKFSSHVVEKCLVVLNDESRSRIVRELLSATHFERLLQDPHANYVVQTALRMSEGPLQNLLIEAIESRKAISRNSPYSKRIFSQKLLKK